MKIEKVNEHQIRCTLTRDDLASRHLKMSELAYGSDKAKDLFRDMMEKANIEYGFQADNVPLMIEAIPMVGETIVLVITKVEDPEELDTRFSKFSPDLDDDDDDSDYGLDSDSDTVTDAGSLISGLVKKIMDASETPKREDATKDLLSSAVAFTFATITEIASLLKKLPAGYKGRTCVYYNGEAKNYILVISKGMADAADFIKACNFLSEHVTMFPKKVVHESFLSEHCDLLIDGNAVEVLSSLY